MLSESWDERGVAWVAGHDYNGLVVRPLVPPAGFAGRLRDIGCGGDTKVCPGSSYLAEGSLTPWVQVDFFFSLPKVTYYRLLSRGIQESRK